MIPFEEALELCIEAVHQGVPVDDLLARYPEYAPRLAPLLGVARELYAAPLEVMSETGFEQQRARLHEQLQARHRWTEIVTESGGWPALLPPHNLASVAPQMGRVPALGEHTAEVLAELKASQDGQK